MCESRDSSGAHAPRGHKGRDALRPVWPLSRTVTQSVTRAVPTQSVGTRVSRVLLLVVLCTPLFFFRLADRDLWSSHEARAAMDAQTILDDGAWGLPHLFDGRPELQKPPLYYWLVAALGRLRGGVDAWAVRLPAALSASLCVLALFLGIHHGRHRPVTAILSAVFLATAVHFTWLARIGRIDMPLTLTVILTAGSFYLALGMTGWPHVLLLISGYCAVAAGVLLKGPIGLVLPAAILLSHLAIEYGPPTPSRWHAWSGALHRLGIAWGLPLFALLGVPWFWWANTATDGEFFRVFVWHHNIERGWGGSTLRANPWWFYLPQFLGDFLPWSPLVPLAVWWSWRRGWWWSDAEARFGLTWFLTVLVVLSCSRFKRADYLLPAYPGAALFLGCAGEHWFRESAFGRRWGGRLAVLGAVLMVLFWLVRVEWVLPRVEPYRDYRPFAACIRRLAPAPARVIFFRTEAHALAFHVGRPLGILIQWQELNAQLLRPGTHYVVMPPPSGAEWSLHLQGVRLERLLSNTDLCGGDHERPLLLFRCTHTDDLRADAATP
jgi:4-amino-4-deoxy-L-arabinose transferase-like glycosyltransferase